jgi:hypothetical protein
MEIQHVDGHTANRKGEQIQEFDYAAESSGVRLREGVFGSEQKRGVA